MSARQNALYRGGLLVSAGAVLWSLVQVLEAVCVPWVRGPEYAPLYAGQLRVFGVLGGSAWPRSWRSSRCTCAKRKRKAGKFQPFRIQKWCCAGSFRSGFLCLGVYQKFVMG